MAEQRFRNFATIVYQESAVSGWRNVINELHVPAFISPLHDSDINDDGTPKKPHWHVMVMFDGAKSKSQISDIFQSFGGVGVEIVQSLRGYARYLCHLDEKSKAKYDMSAVECFSGADYELTIDLISDKYSAICDMQDFIDDNHVYSYAAFCKYCRYNNKQWFRILCDNGTYVIKEYITSLMWTEKNDDTI